MDNWGNLILQNTAASALKTDGVDLSASYEYPTENFGKFTLMGNANLTFNYKVRSDSSLPYHHYKGQWTANFGTSQGLIPDYRLNFGLTWDIHDFSYSILAHYIPAVVDLGFLHPQVGEEFGRKCQRNEGGRGTGEGGGPNLKSEIRNPKFFPASRPPSAFPLIPPPKPAGRPRFFAGKAGFFCAVMRQ